MDNGLNKQENSVQVELYTEASKVFQSYVHSVRERSVEHWENAIQISIIKTQDREARGQVSMIYSCKTDEGKNWISAKVLTDLFRYDFSGFLAVYMKNNPEHAERLSYLLKNYDLQYPSMQDFFLAPLQNAIQFLVFEQSAREANEVKKVVMKAASIDRDTFFLKHQQIITAMEKGDYQYIHDLHKAYGSIMCIGVSSGVYSLLRQLFPIVRKAVTQKYVINQPLITRESS